MINHTKVDAIRKKTTQKSAGWMKYDEPANMAGPKEAPAPPAPRPPVQDSTKKKKKPNVNNLKLRKVLLQQAVPPIKGQPPIPPRNQLALD